MAEKSRSTQQVAEHKTPEDCWIVVDNQVWDVTDFLDKHPGGATSTSIPRSKYMYHRIC